eukprot:g2751.t1
MQFNELQTQKAKQRRQKELNALIDATGTLQTSTPSTNPPGSTQGAPHVDNPGILVENPKPEYQEITTAAFAATRFPGCFASCIRIFHELKTRLPEFHPRRILDFGAGLGTAIWAAEEVWTDSVHQVLAVEPSMSMVVLGNQIHHARKRSLKTTSLIKWVPSLSVNYAQGKHRRQKFNLVVASYVLSELEAEQERRRIVRQLWESCGDLLVLIERGTPFGASTIQEARTLVLDYETKKRRKQELSLLNSGCGVDELSKKVAGVGVHVVAPCPHDGVCPMEGTKSWCHFAQRFQTTRAQRVTKLNPESKFGPRDYEDEKYSYIVLKRGWRRDSVKNKEFLDLKISPHFYQQIKLDDPDEEWTPGKEQKIAKERDFFQGRLDFVPLGSSSDSMESCEVQELLQELKVPTKSTDFDSEDKTQTNGVHDKELSLTLVRPWSLVDNGGPNVRFPEHLSEIKYTDWETLDPEGLKSTRLAATQWSRIIRQPRKRRGHTIVDVCASCDANGCKGKLQRHIVARSDRQKVIGDAAYIMSKKMRWGDLWPSYYNRNHKITNP